MFQTTRQSIRTRLHSKFGTPLVRSRRDIPLHRDEDIEPFFIVGSGRCGTTLLRRILTPDDQVYIPPETRAIQDVVRFYDRNRQITWSEMVSGTLGVFGSQEKFGEYFPNVRMSEVADQLRAIPEAQHSLAKLHNNLFHAFARAAGSKADQWGDKTPMYVFHLGWIDSVFPRARYIHLVRDGIDVAASWMKHLSDPTVEYSANRWLSAIQAFRRFQKHHPERCMEVRYEDIVRETGNTLWSACEFLNLEYREVMSTSTVHVHRMGDASFESHHESVHQPITTDSLGKGRATLTAAQLKRCQKLMGPILDQLGYPPATYERL